MRAVWLGAWVVIASLSACVDLAGSTSNEKGPNLGGSSGDASQVGDGQFPTGGSGGKPLDSGSGGSFGGSAGTIGSGGNSGSGGTAGVVWKIYSKTQAQPTQWSVAPLSAMWSGPNAPPVSGIEAVTQLQRFDRLIVFDDQGMVYVRSGQTWLTPRSVSSAFAAWTYGQVQGVNHQQSAPGYPAQEFVVLLGALGKACIYDFVSADSTFQYKSCVDLGDGAGGFDPPRESVPVDWTIEIYDDNQYKTVGYLQEYSKYGDYVYLFDATPAFTNKWLVQNSPLWLNTTNPPPISGLKAGYFDQVGAIMYLIGP